MKPQFKSRKPYVRSDGNVGPLSQLKLRPLEDREWALSLSTTHSSKDAITEIKNRLGLDLKWEMSYSRFIQWQQQQHRLEDYFDSIRQRRESGELGKAGAVEADRHDHATLLMDEAARSGDGKTFIGVARVSLSESRLAQFARRIDLARQRVKLERKRLEWEIRKQKRAVAALKPPKCDCLTPEEKKAAVAQILGISN
jgi:hypothetical protein